MSTSHTTIQKQTTNLRATQEVVPGTERLEDHLHEQYAINNNSNASSLISILAALAITFTGYGYVLYQYLDCSIARNADILLIVTSAVVGVLLLLYIISINLGSGQRMEQFITFAIRMERYRKDSQLVETYSRIYPNSYNPYNKSYFKFVQGIYNILSVAMVVCLISVVALYFGCLCSEYSPKNPPCDWLSITFNIVWPTSLISMVYYRLKRYGNYLDRQEEYHRKWCQSSNDCNDIWYRNLFGEISDIEKRRRITKCCFPFVTMFLAILLFVFTRCEDCVKTHVYIIMSVIIFFSGLYSILIINTNK